MVRLDANNRRLVAAGLKRLRNGQARPGVLALLQAAGRDPRRAVASDLGFAIGPRINAAGRLSDITLGVECLLADPTGRWYGKGTGFIFANRAVDAKVLRQAAVKDRMRPLSEEGLAVVAAGLTSLDEMQRVFGTKKEAGTPAASKTVPQAVPKAVPKNGAQPGAQPGGKK